MGFFFNSLANITLSEMGKQTAQAKEVYYLSLFPVEW